MNHTLKQQAALRHALPTRRRMPLAGWFWIAYALAVVIGAYAVSEFVARVFA